MLRTACGHKVLSDRTGDFSSAVEAHVALTVPTLDVVISVKFKVVLLALDTTY